MAPHMAAIDWPQPCTYCAATFKQHTSINTCGSPLDARAGARVRAILTRCRRFACWLRDGTPFCALREASLPQCLSIRAPCGILASPFVTLRAGYVAFAGLTYGDMVSGALVRTHVGGRSAWINSAILQYFTVSQARHFRAAPHARARLPPPTCLPFTHTTDRVNTLGRLYAPRAFILRLRCSPQYR